MAKVIRPTYPLEFSIGLLLLIFALSAFLSSQIFRVSWHEIIEGSPALFGMAVVIMALILWEEFLFPVKIKPMADQVVFRNHQTKLKTQVLIYLAIPALFAFIYFNYEVNHVRFFIWAAICISVPVMAKLISGIKNYNDFLKLNYNLLEYQNNEKKGIFKTTDIQQITLMKDDRGVLHKIQVTLKNNTSEMIDIDEMELEAFYEFIEKSLTVHYKNLIK
ncbi:MAG: heavy metal transporter [Cyclobacteriaceae bacterium]|nr:heavy metal transporter [Cyclobacteriaceae bacterium]